MEIINIEEAHKICSKYYAKRMKDIPEEDHAIVAKARKMLRDQKPSGRRQKQIFPPHYGKFLSEVAIGEKIEKAAGRCLQPSNHKPIKEILNTPKVKEALSIMPALREAMIEYLGPQLDNVIARINQFINENPDKDGVEAAFKLLDVMMNLIGAGSKSPMVVTNINQNIEQNTDRQEQPKDRDTLIEELYQRQREWNEREEKRELLIPPESVEDGEERYPGDE
jgi:hypothetical protein